MHDLPTPEEPIIKNLNKKSKTIQNYEQIKNSTATKTLYNFSQMLDTICMKLLSFVDLTSKQICQFSEI